MGSSNYRYLELVLIDQEYANIPNIHLFIILAYPRPLSILGNIILVEVLQLKDEHTEVKRLYLEYKIIEKVLLRYI